MKTHLQKIIFLALVLCLLFPPLTRATTPSEQNPPLSGTDQATQDELTQELSNVEAQITDLEQQLAATTGEKKTLANKIKELKQEQTQLRLQIKATTLRLKDLQKKLTKTEQGITVTIAKRAKLKIELTELVRQMQQKDRSLFLFNLLTQDGLAGAFIEAKNYELLSEAISTLVAKTKALQVELNTEQITYTAQKDDTRELLTLATIQQTTLGGKMQEQAQLLEETKGREANYQNLLEDNRRRAAEIKSRIYDLLGVSTQMTFGQAVTIAQWVDKQTGVPAAFLLAIVTQESNLGKNVGTCNRPGDPPEKSWKVVMKPDRDQEPFVTITNELTRDTDITPVSCPMKDKKGKQLGWGGAMGPAQFIPSTWIGYRNRVATLTGKKADPWDTRDAFAAAAILLKANGADETKDGQWKAAMRYFSGSTNTRYRFYGDNVLALTAKYEQDMKDLTL